MRDTNRIRPFLDKLAECWEKYPDLRFFQLIAALQAGKDLFYIEEEEALVLIEKFSEKK